MPPKSRYRGLPLPPPPERIPFKEPPYITVKDSLGLPIPPPPERKTISESPSITEKKSLGPPPPPTGKWTKSPFITEKKSLGPPPPPTGKWTKSPFITERYRGLPLPPPPERIPFKEPPYITVVKVLYEFDGNSDYGELSVRAGEELTVTAQDIGDGWWEARNTLGHIGLIPEAYVQLIPPPPERRQLIKESPSTTEISSTLTSSPQTAIKKCVFCGNKGIYFCYDCKSAFCKPCRDTHDKPLPSKKHTVTDLKSVNASAVKLMCELHKSEFTFYCIPCNTLVCNICITSDHKEHGMSGISEKSDEIKRLAQTKLSDMKDKLQRISKLVEKTKMVHIPKLDEESGNAIARIGSIGKELQKLIETKIDMKVYEVQDATHWKKEELQSVLKNKERIYRKQTAVYESLETLLSEEHAVSFLVSYQTLKRDMCDLTSEAKDDIEPHHVQTPDLKGFLDETISSLQEYRKKLE